MEELVVFSVLVVGGVYGVLTSRSVQHMITHYFSVKRVVHQIPVLADREAGREELIRAIEEGRSPNPEVVYKDVVVNLAHPVTLYLYTHYTVSTLVSILVTVFIVNPFGLVTNVLYGLCLGVMLHHNELVKEKEGRARKKEGCQSCKDKEEEYGE